LAALFFAKDLFFAPAGGKKTFQFFYKENPTPDVILRDGASNYSVREDLAF
tara:strand:- start:734 stop:886 length:153 start_codon:yes stop_codon:yes gene_type:complete